MSYYLATHQDSGHELFSHRDDAKQWVEYQADFHEQRIGKWITHGEEESLRLADGKTYAGTVRMMQLDQRAEHRQYETEQRAAKREAELDRLRAERDEAREQCTEMGRQHGFAQDEARGRVEALRAELEQAQERSSARLAAVHQRDMELLAARTPKQRLQAAVDKANAAVPAYALRVLRAVTQEINTIEGEWFSAHRADAEDVLAVLRRIRATIDAVPPKPETDGAQQ